MACRDRSWEELEREAASIDQSRMDGTIYIANNGRVYNGGRLVEDPPISPEQQEQRKANLMETFRYFAAPCIYDLKENPTVYGEYDMDIAFLKRDVLELRGSVYEEEANAVLEAVLARREEFLRLVRKGELLRDCCRRDGKKFLVLIEERQCYGTDEEEAAKERAHLRRLGFNSWDELNASITEKYKSYGKNAAAKGVFK